MAAGLDGPALRRAMTQYLETLRAHCAELDSINVFPVADGDTGTNLVRTQEAVEHALGALPLDAGRDVIAETVAGASLRGARGNSGVVLSQMLRGIGTADGSDVAAALEAGAAAVALAFARPVEGTAVTVTRDAAAAARARATGGATVLEVLEAGLVAARASLAKTTHALPELRDACVVDAGAKGIVLLLDALAAALEGRPVSPAPGERGPVDGDRRWDGGEHYEVEYLLDAPDGVAARLRAAIDGLGDSVAVVEHGGVVRVHAHTDRPQEVLDAGARLASPRAVSVVRLDGGGVP